eukprot:1422196-Pyramimonas_sp.AAC.1
MLMVMRGRRRTYTCTDLDSELQSCRFRRVVLALPRREGDPGGGGLQGTRPCAGQPGGPASRGLPTFSASRGLTLCSDAIVLCVECSSEC